MLVVTEIYLLPDFLVLDRVNGTMIIWRKCNEVPGIYAGRVLAFVMDLEASRYFVEPKYVHEAISFFAAKNRSSVFVFANPTPALPGFVLYYELIEFLSELQSRDFLRHAVGWHASRHNQQD